MVRTSTASATPESAPVIPTFDKREKLIRYLSEEMGEDTLANLEKAANNAERRRFLIEALQRKYPEMNGKAEKAAERLLLNKQEIERKEGWFSWIIKAPFRGMKRSWEFAKKHPIVATLILASLAAGGVAAGYYLTGNWALLLSKLGVSAQQVASGVEEALNVMQPVTEALPGTGAAGGGAISGLTP